MKVFRKDIAAAAGVSLSTVGMILSGKGENYNEDTRRLVLETAKKLGYEPSINARALRLQRSLLIGVLLNEVNSHLTSQFLLGVQQALGSTDYSPVVFFAKDDQDQAKCLERCLHRQVDGLLMNCAVGSDPSGLQSVVTRLQSSRVPVIETFGHFLPGFPSANVDYTEAGRLGAEHLLSLGHRRIALVTHARYERHDLHFDAWQQFVGYRDALAAAGVKPLVVSPEIDFENVTIGSFIQAGHDAFGLMEKEPAMPTAAICYADVVAYGLNRALRENGIQVPQEFSIVGNLDMMLSSEVNPPLTTTRANYFEVGRQAAAHLIAAIEGGTMQDLLVPLELIVRQSTAPVAER